MASQKKHLQVSFTAHLLLILLIEAWFNNSMSKECSKKMPISPICPNSSKNNHFERHNLYSWDREGYRGKLDIPRIDLKKKKYPWPMKRDVSAAKCARKSTGSEWNVRTRRDESSAQKCQDTTHRPLSLPVAPVASDPGNVTRQQITLPFTRC